MQTNLSHDPNILDNEEGWEYINGQLVAWTPVVGERRFTPNSKIKCPICKTIIGVSYSGKRFLLLHQGGKKCKQAQRKLEKIRSQGANRSLSGPTLAPSFGRGIHPVNESKGIREYHSSLEAIKKPPQPKTKTLLTDPTVSWSGGSLDLDHCIPTGPITRAVPLHAIAEGVLGTSSPSSIEWTPPSTPLSLPPPLSLFSAQPVAPVVLHFAPRKLERATSPEYITHLEHDSEIAHISDPVHNTSLSRIHSLQQNHGPGSILRLVDTHISPHSPHQVYSPGQEYGPIPPLNPSPQRNHTQVRYDNLAYSPHPEYLPNIERRPESKCEPTPIVVEDSSDEEQEYVRAPEKYGFVVVPSRTNDMRMLPEAKQLLYEEKPYVPSYMGDAYPASRVEYSRVMPKVEDVQIPSTVIESRHFVLQAGSVEGETRFWDETPEGKMFLMALKETLEKTG